MKLWLIVIQGDDTTWVEDAWDDNSTTENPSGWEEALTKARKLAFENNYELRILPVQVAGVYEQFEPAELKGRVAQ